MKQYLINEETLTIIIQNGNYIIQELNKLDFPFKNNALAIIDNSNKELIKRIIAGLVSEDKKEAEAVNE